MISPVDFTNVMEETCIALPIHQMVNRLRAAVGTSRRYFSTPTPVSSLRFLVAIYHWLLACSSLLLRIKLLRQVPMAVFDCGIDHATLYTPVLPMSFQFRFSPDGCTLLSASYWTICMRDAQTGSVNGVLRGHTNNVRDAVFSPNGLRIASCVVWTKLCGSGMLRAEN